MKPADQIKYWVGKTRDVLRTQHKSYATEKDYCGWLTRYFAFTTRLASGFSHEQKAEKFLTHLAVDCNVSDSTQSSAFFAILFFYKHVVRKPLEKVDSFRATRSQHVRMSPTISDTHRLLDALPDVSGYPTNLIGRILYSRGLRVREPLNWRMKDVQFEGRKLFIMAGKGKKDRVVRMDDWMVEPLQRQIIAALLVWESDVRDRLPLEIPNLLAVKYPDYKFSKHWAWVFPAKHSCEHPRTGETVRYHMHPCYVQRAFKIAGRKTGVFAIPHLMRHAHASHLLESNLASIKALQEEMGHVDPRTTLGYCHADALSVPDPTILAQNRNVITIEPCIHRRIEYHNPKPNE